MADKTRTHDGLASPIPGAFLHRMAAALGDEFDAFLASLQAPSVQGLRANTLKIAPADLMQRLPSEWHAGPWQPVPWSPETFVLSDPAIRPGRHPYHAAGLYYLQDPSATAPVELLDPQPGEIVLDLAAAPGGKSTHIAARLQDRGLLIANEVIHKRAWELAGNLERWGATNMAITTESPERLAARWPGFFDAVLVDAPCSGEGMFRKSEAARREWTAALVEGCAVRQDGILDQAAKLVRPGGRLVYSTCTFAPDENEGAVARFLNRHPEFSLAEPPTRPGFQPGRPEWLPESLRRPELTRCLRLWPHHIQGEGHFAALLVKGDESERYSPSKYLLPRLPKGAREGYSAFITDTFVTSPTQEPLILDGAYLYAVPADMPDLAGLRPAGPRAEGPRNGGMRYLHPGWWLGEVKKDRFEPSHALALGASMLTRWNPLVNGKLGIARRVASYAVGDPDLLAYMKGETVGSTGEDGWTLVTVDNFPLGWAKRVGGKLKSHYPKGLRLVADQG